MPWLAASQQRVPLRGLMFSLPDSHSIHPTEGTADAEKFIPQSQRHALTLPVTGRVSWTTVPVFVAAESVWRGNRRLRTLMAIMGIWGAGTLLSFAVNRQQIVSVAEQAHARWSILRYRMSS